MAHVTGSTAEQILTRTKTIVDQARNKLMEIYGSIEADHTEAVKPQVKFTCEDELDVEAANLLELAGQASWITDPGPTGSFLVHDGSEAPANAQNAIRTSLLLARKVEKLHATVLELTARLDKAEGKALEAPKPAKALPPPKSRRERDARDEADELLDKAEGKK